MADELTTKPTIETVLERLAEFGERFETRFNQLESRFDQLESRFDQLESRINERFEHVYTEIDRVASVAHSTKGEMLALRVEFREMRTQLKEVIPTPNRP